MNICPKTKFYNLLLAAFHHNMYNTSLSVINKKTDNENFKNIQFQFYDIEIKDMFDHL